MPIKHYIDALQNLEQTYRPNSTVAAGLSMKKLALIVGPTAVGKSTLMNNIVQIDTRFARISGLTSRPARTEDEPGMYRYIQHDEPHLKEVLRKVEAGELVQYAIHPTTGYIYATETQDYPSIYNCADVLGHAVSAFRGLPSGGSYTYSIVCSPSNWQQRLYTRYPSPDDPDLTKRLAEATINLEWSLQDPKTVWIENSDNQLESASQAIIRLTTTNTKPDTKQQTILRSKAQSMIELHATV